MTRTLLAVLVLLVASLCSVESAALSDTFLEDLSLTASDPFPYHEDREMVLADAPTLEPTAEPTVAPTSVSPRPTALPTIGAEFLLYDVTLKLTDATSDVLSDTDATVLTESVATASGVATSDVVLDSYTATSGSRVSALLASSKHQTSKESAFISTLKRSLRYTFTTQYSIEAILSITAAIADYPQFNNNITALYNQLTSSLRTAAEDNTLAALIRQASIDAGSDTFATIGDVVIQDISDPIAQYYPSSAPTGAPVPDGHFYDPGEMAGIIIAVMFVIGLCAAGVYMLCTRKKDRSAAYVVTGGADPAPTAPKWTPIVVTQGANNTEFTNIADENMVL